VIDFLQTNKYESVAYRGFWLLS